MPAAAPSIADPPAEAWLRERVEALAAIERPSASDGERLAAEWMMGELHEAGARQARIEEEPEANGTYWNALGLLGAAGAAAGVAALRGGPLGRAAAVAVGAAASALAADEMPPGRRTMRRMLPGRTAHQVLAEVGPADAERTIVLMAHHDAAHTAFFFNPEIPERAHEAAPWIIDGGDTSPPLMWPVVGGPAVVAAGAALGSRALTGLGTFLSAGTAAFMAHIGASPVVPGANDNATGCAALIALARVLSQNPPTSTRIVFLSTSEEALCEGMGLFMDRHGHELPVDSTFFLSIDTVGSPHLLILRGEGMLAMRDYPAESLALADDTAAGLGIDLFPNLRLRNATDGVFPLRAGYQCVSMASCTDLKQPSNYHWPTDTPDRVDYGTVADAIRLSEAMVRRLDADWL